MKNNLKEKLNQQIVRGQERNPYREEFDKNEADANWRMSISNAIAGVALLTVWILYLTHVFELHVTTFRFVVWILPILTAILFSPLCYLKSKALEKPGYKYFLVFSLLTVIAAINILIPKHGVLGWPIPLILACHFYNPRLCKIVFGVTLAAMFVCLYGGMFNGEYDPYLVSDGLYNGQVMYPYVNGEYVYPESMEERHAVLTRLLQLGENRYLKVLVFYYLPRATFLTIIFVITNSLNKRTSRLLTREIEISNEQGRTTAELEVAKDIQYATLPPVIEASADLEIIGELKAAKEVGGDFYDYFDLDDDHTVILIGDVSGKGVPAAMFMMRTITCLRNFARLGKSPSQILKEANDALMRGNENQMFVTCFLAILNKRNGEVSFANAGHNPPVVGYEHHYRYLPCKSGFLLGSFPNPPIVDEKMVLQPGESFTIYTDGLTEARNAGGDFFGAERLLNAFNKKEYTCLVELHHGIRDEIAAFVKDAPQSDDMAFVTIKYHGDRYSYEERLFDGKIDQIPQMLDFIKSFCEKRSFKPDFNANLLVVGDELFSNIVKYGYQNQGGEIFIRLLYNEDKKEFALTVVDKAPRFNPLDVEPQVIEGEAKDQKIGGLGILIVKNIMTDTTYDRVNKKNILVLRKRF